MAAQTASSHKKLDRTKSTMSEGERKEKESNEAKMDVTLLHALEDVRLPVVSFAETDRHIVELTMSSSFCGAITAFMIEFWTIPSDMSMKTNFSIVKDAECSL
jgi:hypothetical protein